MDDLPVKTPHAGLRLGAVREFYRAEGYRPEESIGYLMRRILAAVAQGVDLQMCDSGPTFPQGIALYKLHQGLATTVAELARECQLDTGAMTRLLDRLEAKGLCRRVRSLEDRRVVHIELTGEGRIAAEQVPHVMSRVQNDALAGFAEAEWLQLRGYLQRIFDNTQAMAARREKND